MMTPRCPDCKRDQDDCVCIDAQEQIATLTAKLAETEKQLAEAMKDADAKQARIDELMLEFCPAEMTADQLAEYVKHQRPLFVDDTAIRAMKEE